MAFNFNWSPLTADAEFYSRAQDMLTTALNKSPKPPIIVDDILVNELNLGSVPPELEILEIGDLAEDRFRGIFKMCYSGDAFLTLKTRVQANPLNTYLFSKPSFTSPQPLAASSGLTIPLQITLSEIKLSAFIILVFSRQKGLTLVFRNDPLESLKVSSTFDSIPFVCEYLQKEIEAQLRVLMMEELPAIIHKMSLRLWCPDQIREAEAAARATEKLKGEVRTDPFASPPQDAVDVHGNVLDASEISSLSLEGGLETHSLFSQKNLLRLGVLTDSQRTLSLFTPSIRDAVFRAWAGPAERSDSGASAASTPPTLTRSHSTSGSIGTTYTFSDHGAEMSHLPSRPSLVNLHSATTGLSLGAGRHSRTNGRKKKTRVVNLRKHKTSDDTASESGESTTATESSYLGGSEPVIPTRIPEVPEEEPMTPPRSPTGKVRFRSREDSIDLGETPRRLRPLIPVRNAEEPLVTIAITTQEALARAINEPNVPIELTPQSPSETRSSLKRTPTWTYPTEKSGNAASSNSNSSVPISYTSASYVDINGAGIIEQAWMKMMAGEIARRAHDQKVAEAGSWASQADRETEEMPPPAYAAQ